MTDTLRVFKALANPHRLQILNLLHGFKPSEFTVSGLAEHLNISQPQTSQHLITLRSAGLIVQRSIGTTVWNSISPNLVWPVKVFK